MLVGRQPAAEKMVRHRQQRVWVEGTGFTADDRSHDTLLMGFDRVAQRPRQSARAGEFRPAEPSGGRTNAMTRSYSKRSRSG